MTMFDYDARPVTPQVVLIGTRSSADAYTIRDFLTRNGRPYEWVDVDERGGLDPLLAGMRGHGVAALASTGQLREANAIGPPRLHPGRARVVGRREFLDRTPQE